MNDAVYRVRQLLRMVPRKAARLLKEQIGWYQTTALVPTLIPTNDWFEETECIHRLGLLRDITRDGFL